MRSIDKNWRTSSYTTAENVNCVECRADGGVVQVRDTQHRELGRLSVSAREWRAFLAEVDRF
ncbi:DUF397 domain-containing protein [Allosalinactinospora lopnorensis]|uniref:DUF397 domain-containing protein n=1 Tax=Allosalinactinospora lopnorensis TaxID=1352348 RepID=UPI000623F774|nr:DUF397 domain-containing protein [Allosalinactinospora lopnorensis]